MLRTVQQAMNQFTQKICLGNKGIAIIEILIVIAIIVIASTAFMGIAVTSLKLSDSIKKASIADFLMRDAVEIVRAFRNETDWEADGLGTLNTGISYYPQLGSNWSFLSGSETIGNFTREIVFEDVSRDNNDNIENTYNPLNKDNNTKKVIVRVSWDSKSLELITYLTNWMQ